MFAAKPCCPQRVTCNNCRKCTHRICLCSNFSTLDQPLGDFNTPRPFSFFSRMEACSRCGYADYHCVKVRLLSQNQFNLTKLKPLSSYRMVPCSVLNTMMSPTKTSTSPKINPNHFPPLGHEEQEKRASPESPSQQIQHKQKQEVEKKVRFDDKSAVSDDKQPQNNR